MAGEDEVDRFERWLAGQRDRPDDVGVVAQRWGDAGADWSGRPMRHALQVAMREFLDGAAQPR